MRRWIRLLGLFVLLPRLLGNTPLPTSAVFERPTLNHLTLSADGSKLVAVVRDKNNEFLQEIDPVTLRPTLLAHFADARVADLWWKGNDLILFVVDYGDSDYAWHALDVVTKKVDRLNLLNTWRVAMLNELRDEPDEVVVMTSRRAVCRFNVRTGKLHQLEKDLGGISRWMVDAAGAPLGALATRRDRSTLWWRPAPGAKWSELDLGPIDDPAIVIAGPHRDGRRFLAWDYRTEDVPLVVAFDPATGEKELVLRSDEVEPEHVLLWPGDDALPKAIVYENQSRTRHFLDDHAAALQTSIDHALPGTWNTVVSISRDRQRAVVRISSEAEPGRYFLLDRRAKRLSPLGPRFGGRQNIGFGSGRLIRFEARDGMKLRGRLLLPPAGAAKPPLVVVTGDQFANYRSRGVFDAFQQLLATRGIAVARIDTRGTNGLGRAYAEAGNYQIHDAIPKDLIDGVRWLVSEGLVDERRIVIMGTYHGGIVALHALEQAPDLFAGWINWNTPPSLRTLDYDEYATAARTWRDAVDDLGGFRHARKLKTLIDPAPLFASIRVPSCHFYLWGMGHEGEVRQLLKKSGAPHTILKARPTHTQEDYVTHVSETLDQMLRFLAERFAGPP